MELGRGLSVSAGCWMTVSGKAASQQFDAWL